MTPFSSQVIVGQISFEKNISSHDALEKFIGDVKTAMHLIIKSRSFVGMD